MKKHNAINYHAVREVVAAGILRVGKEDGETNLADLLTKVVTGQKRWDFCYCLFCGVGLTARLYRQHVATVLPPMRVKKVGGFIIWVDVW
jgi:hypothetical protein